MKIDNQNEKPSISLEEERRRVAAKMIFDYYAIGESNITLTMDKNTIEKMGTYPSNMKHWDDGSTGIVQRIKELERYFETGDFYRKKR